MSKTHTYYEPTEYEQMLIAAGWVTIESLDTEYQEHATSNNDACSYSSWKSLRLRYDELNEQYEKDVEPYYISGNCKPIPYEVEQHGKRLLRAMTDIEIALGY